ncbi:UreE urease accessory domain protein [Beijerinckia indica subsp. indica ATCC 9039]|uniref:Urease accessory protein UreE n=2 Tax=Beijerinckia TaxID=532 RepID=UREE_BEII9|nr:RecName: Full=Urease accessory protein UreE [Beijerinckia indica subsp. indica ATCC 9039]ACB96819.1 UreE urease accessory domain protein [Beijerinckia indica subsp. indica ATCC 9039]
MLRASSVLPRGSWHEPAADVVVLDYDARHRRRIRMRGVRGLDFLLDLENALMLRHGDAVKLDDGRLIEIVAAPEHLVEITCPDAAKLAKIAWHLGNRHLPVEFAGTKLRIRYDPVIASMLKNFSARLREIEAPFEPEGGAYAGSGQDHHDHSHGEHTQGEHTHDEAAEPHHHG